MESKKKVVQGLGLVELMGGPQVAKLARDEKKCPPTLATNPPEILRKAQGQEEQR